MSREDVKIAVQIYLTNIFNLAGCDRPDCYHDMVEYMVDDVIETSAFPEIFSDGDVTIAFRRCLEYYIN